MEFHVEDPVFKTDTLFVIGVPIATFARRMKRVYNRDIDLAEHYTGTMFTFTRPPWRCVWTAKKDLPTVIHETLHLVTRILYDRGIAVSAQNAEGHNDDETAAYLLEFYVRAILKRMR